MTLFALLIIAIALVAAGAAVIFFGALVLGFTIAPWVAVVLSGVVCLLCLLVQWKVMEHETDEALRAFIRGMKGR